LEKPSLRKNIVSAAVVCCPFALFDERAGVENAGTAKNAVRCEHYPPAAVLKDCHSNQRPPVMRDQRVRGIGKEDGPA
jgi:hypothetical protein